jgi:hypothetical protein
MQFAWYGNPRERGKDYYVQPFRRPCSSQPPCLVTGAGRPGDSAEVLAGDLLLGPACDVPERRDALWYSGWSCSGRVLRFGRAASGTPQVAFDLELGDLGFGDAGRLLGRGGMRVGVHTSGGRYRAVHRVLEDRVDPVGVGKVESSGDRVRSAP